MLLSLVLELRPINDSAIPFSHGRALHALFFNILANIDSKTAELVHDSTEELNSHEKPFTISPLMGRMARKGNTLQLKKDNIYYVRITSLEHELTSFLIKNLKTVSNKTVTIASTEFIIDRVIFNNKIHPDAKKVSYSDIVRKYLLLKDDEIKELPDKIRIKFISPTTFREGKRNYPLPSPEKVYNMLVSKWEKYSSISFKEEEKVSNKEILDELVRNIIISSLKIQSRMVNFENYKIIGFVGECEFMFRTWDPLPKYKKNLLKQWFHVVSDFAFYAGVGYKTTMGLGQVRIFK